MWYKRILLLLLLQCREYNDKFQFITKRSLLGELKLTKPFETRGDPVIVRLEHLNLADESRVEIFGVLIRRIILLQLDFQLSDPHLHSF